MAKFKPYMDVAVGINEIGSSPYGTVNILPHNGAAGTVGVLIGETFIPLVSGPTGDGENLTVVVGHGRRIAFNATASGKISTAEV
jgi:hypothetical protein